jgi:LPXTG-site transpeptidase (sortase) family protein
LIAYDKDRADPRDSLTLLVNTLAQHRKGLPMPRGFRPAVLSMLLIAALALVACGGSDKNDDDRVSVTGLSSATAASDATSAAGTAAAGGMPEPDEGVLLERLQVPSIRVDAPVETLGVNARGAMEDPVGKDAVAWYNFSEFPGYGGNAVFSGHVDWYTGELGVFGRVKELKDGDEIVIKLSDGMEIKYKVVSTTLYKSSDAPIDRIVGRTEKDSLTFITCEGTFDRGAQDYSHRRVVRAERVA